MMAHPPDICGMGTDVWSAESGLMMRMGQETGTHGITERGRFAAAIAGVVRKHAWWFEHIYAECQRKVWLRSTMHRTLVCPALTSHPRMGLVARQLMEHDARDVGSGGTQTDAIWRSRDARACVHLQ